MRMRHLMRVLDLDIENRPLAYLGPDYTTGEVTAIACCWVGQPETLTAWLLGRETREKILDEFLWRYDQAELVTGHYIREHDLPVINGALLELGRRPLAPKLTSDTKLDLVNRKYLSASQENLAAVLGVAIPKVSMSNADWREANRLTPAGLQKTYRRVTGDVIQHMALRARLLELGLLKPPRVWAP